jgi:NAD(P)H-hydrate epimerase
MAAQVQENTPEVWIDSVPIAKAQDHKYTRGQVAVLGGDEMTGAACLVADAAARCGAGLVTLIAQKQSIFQILNPNSVDPLIIYRSFRPYIIARRNYNIDKALKKGRVACVIGPGLGDNAYIQVREIILDILSKGESTPVVIDADGLNAFIGENENKILCQALHKHSVLTPHEGEFKKFFPHLANAVIEDRYEAVSKAARLLHGGVLVLKGRETIIAQYKDGAEHLLVNKVASPYLATAGSGDVLSGLIAGLMAQGMDGFLAAAAGVWMHGRASQNLGSGLVAEDLVKNIPMVLKEMLGI